MVDPWQALTASQRKALGLATDAFDGVVRTAKAGITQPEETLARLTSLVAAVGDLAASTTKPMEALLSSQRNLANAMAAFADLQKEMSEVLATVAASHLAVVDALDKLASPVLTVSDMVRREPTVKKAQKRVRKPAPRS